MKKRTFSIGRIFVLLAILQALVIATAAFGVAYTMRPPPPNFDHKISHKMPPHRMKRDHGILWTLIVLFAILIVSNILVARWILLPVRRLRQVTQTFGRGEWTRRISNIRNDEFGELARAFNEMADRIEGQMKAEREIIATVSHELRTPLTRLRVALELLEDEHPDSVRKLQTMTGDIVEIEQLIDNVFTSARLSNYSNQGVILESEMRTVSVEKLIQRSIDRFKARYPVRKVRVDDVCEREVTVGPILFRRALENLLENAHKYSDHGTHIDICARQKVDQILFTVSSVGEPIPEGQRMKIFDPFFQMQNTQGTGLGLTLVKRIAEAHGGTAWVVCQSRKNTFIIQTPVAMNQSSD